MENDSDLLALEKGFWTRGAGFFDEHLAADATMVFPAPTGVLRRERILSSIEHTQRWQSVRMHDPVVARPSATVAVLTYRAEALRRRNDAPYRAHVTSVYRRADDEWRLAFHQQSPPPDQPRAEVAPQAPARATAVPAMVVGALATSAVAIGALAVGRLAIAGLAIDHARVRSLGIDELTVNRVRLREPLDASQ
jgi:hypothetical protein